MNHIAHKEGQAGAGSHDAPDLRPEAARRRLHECRDQRHACEVIREIVSNLLGCEEMALFQVEEDNARLTMIWSFGIEAHAHLAAILNGPEVSAVLGGDMRIHEDAAAPSVRSHRASAIVPIRVHDATAGVLVLMRLLPQKVRIDELDRRLLAVISSEAGKPLFGARSNGVARHERKR